MTDYLSLARTLSPQSTETNDNPYLPIAQGDQERASNRLRTVVETALRDDPDLAAERLRISKQSGVPLRVVERNLDELRVKERAKSFDLARMASESPVLYRQMVDPTFTTPAIDDIPTLQKIEQSIGKGVAYVMGATPDGGLPSDTVDFGKDVALGATVGVGKTMFNLAGVVNDLIGWQSGAQAARAQAKRAQESMDAFGSQGQSSTAQAIRSGAQSAGQNLAMLPLGLERGLYQTAEAAGSVVAAAMASGVGAEAYNKARDMGKSQLQASAYAIPEAAFEYVFEQIPASKLFKDIALNEPLLKTIGKQFFHENWTEQLTTLAQDFNEWMNINPDKTLGQFIKERPEAAYQTFVATLVGVGVQTSTLHGINKIVEKASNQQLAYEQDLLDAQMKLAAQSLLRQRSPDQFRAHVQNVLDENDSAKKEIYIDGEVLNQLAPELLAQLPQSVRDQIDSAVASGSTVAIPMVDVLTVAPGTPLEQMLNENARMTPDALSKAEASLVSDMLRQDADRVMAEAQDQAAWQQSADNVKANLLGQLNTAGRFTPDVNEAYATMVRDFYATMAGRQGITPEEMFQRYPLRIAAQGVGGQQLDQAKGQDKRDLVVTHNLTADNLLHAVKMGGIAVPSLAVTKKDNPLTGFGEVTLIGPPELADPKGYAGTKVFGADIYSPRYPSVTFEFTPNMRKRGEAMLKDGMAATGTTYLDWSEVERDGARELERLPAVLWQFLKSKGVEPTVVRTESKPLPAQLQPFKDDTRHSHELAADPAFVEAAWAAQLEMLTQAYGDATEAAADIAKQKETAAQRGRSQLVNSYANSVQQYQRDVREAGRIESDATRRVLQKQVRDADLDTELTAYASEFISDLNPNERIFQGFTNSGNRKYVPHTLENVVKILKKELRGGENFNYGVGSLRAKFTPQFKSVADIRKNKDRLISAADFDKIKDDINTEFLNMADAMGIRSETLSAIMEDAAKMGVQRAAAQYKVDVGGDRDVQIAEFMTRLRNLPTAYFEAKVMREVDLAEFAGAVVPEGVNPEVLKALAARGVKDVRTYKKGDEADRAARIGEFENQFFQGARGTFNPEQMLLTLNENADLSTFLHESGHFFLEVMADLASQPNAPTDVADDMAKLLKWFGVADAATWNAMTLDQKRPHHERFAESFEQYLLEGKAPSAELQPLFRRFRAWMVNVYKSLTHFMRGRDLKLSDEVRQVFDRMLAAEDAIAQQEEASGLLPDFDATNEAIEKLQVRSLRDLKWTVNARSRALKALQKEAEALRREVRMDARREVMSHPVYRAYRFLTAKMSKADHEAVKPVAAPKSVDGPVDESVDSMFAAIAKLGGLDRAEVESQWGFDKKERSPSPLFGKPLLRRTKGLSLDAMGERLAEYGYLTKDENGKYDMADFEAAFDSEYRGSAIYAYGFDYARAQGEQRAGEGASEDMLGAGRFDLTALKSIDVPDDVITKLTERGMTAKDGIDPNILADMFGFDSGQEFAKIMADAFPMGQEIEGTTDRLMLERHGELATPEAIEEAANDAVHNEARAKSLATELKTQADMLNPREQTGTASNGRAITVNALTKAANEFAVNLAARRKVKDLKGAAAQHRAAEAKAGKRWQEATTKGETKDAVAAKRDQVLNNATVKALNEAQAEAKKILEFFRKVTKDGNEKLVDKGRDPDVVNAMRAILAAYDVAPRLEKGALEYMELVAKNDPIMYGALQPSVQGAMNNAKPLAEMTMEELRGLHDELRAMWHLAKRSRQMEVDGNLLDIEDAADELVTRLDTVGIPLTIPGERAAITPGEEFGIKLQFVKSILSRVEQWAERLDGKFGGPFLRLVFQPVKDAADRYRTDKTAYRTKFTELVKNVAPSLPDGFIDAPELSYKFGNGKDSGAAELLHAILHTGNDSNKRKLLLGRGWATENADSTLDTTKWDAFVTRMVNEGKLNKAHYDFAQGVWDLLEEMKPLAQETHRKVFGRYFAEVTANGFDTPFGPYRGGYVPAQTDSRLVKDAKLRELAEGENESMAYAFPASPSGFTKARVEYNKPLLLDLRALAQHMDKVLLFSHMQGAVTDVRRLLTNKRVSYALDRVDPGAYEGMLIPWLGRAAKQIVETPVAGDRKLSRFLSAARSRAGMALMFANLSNTVQQITGFSTAAVKVKPGLLMSSLATFTAGPKAMREAVVQASPFMKDRMQNEVSAMNNVVEEILVNPTLMERSQAWTQKHAYFLQSAVDNTMAPIIWTAAYNQSIAQQMEHSEAVRFADGVVRQTQGSTLPEDVSRFETGPAMVRVFTQFIGYFNMMANTNATAMSQIVDDVGLRKGAGKLLYVALAGLLAPIWVAEAISQAFKGGPDDEDRDGWLDDWLMAVFGLGTLKGLTAMVPVVGQAAQLVVSQFNSNPADDKFSLSPAVSLIESAARSPKSVYDAIVEDGNIQKAVRDVAAAATMATGLPFYAAARPVGYLAGVAQGKIEPTSEVDAVRGVLTGTASKESKQR